MKPIWTVLAAAALIACTAPWVAPSLAQAQKRPVFVEYAPPPDTIDEMTARVDVVVVGQVEAWRPQKHYPSDATRPTLMTAYEVSVVEILKGDGRVTQPPSTMTVVRFGGTSEDGTMESVTPGFDRFKKGDSLLLFLRWTPQFGGYSIAYGPDGAYAIEDAAIKPYGQSPVAEKQRGRPSSDFLATIRNRAKDRKK